MRERCNKDEGKLRCTRVTRRPYIYTVRAQRAEFPATCSKSSLITKSSHVNPKASFSPQAHGSVYEVRPCDRISRMALTGTSASNAILRSLASSGLMLRR